MQKFKRRNKLPKPSLQLRLTLTFMGTLVLGILLQLMLTRSSMLRLVLQLPNDGALLMDEINKMQFETLWVSLLILLPICFVVGVLSTFRVAGPLYRFEDHLRRLARGEDPGPCRIRKGDHLQELCQLLNDATFALRAGAPNAPAKSPIQTQPYSLVAASRERPQLDREYGTG